MFFCSSTNAYKTESTRKKQTMINHWDICLTNIFSKQTFRASRGWWSSSGKPTPSHLISRLLSGWGTERSVLHTVSRWSSPTLGVATHPSEAIRVFRLWTVSPPGRESTWHCNPRQILHLALEKSTSLLKVGWTLLLSSIMNLLHNIKVIRKGDILLPYLELILFATYF